MILTALSLENFRQFYGEQRIDLSTTKDRNVVVIYGANGSGKTTLLNAFTWVLYKSFSPGFEQPDHLVNERAWDEAAIGTEVRAEVILEFDDEGNKYTVTRSTVQRKEADGSVLTVRDAAVSVSFIDEDGETHNRDHAHSGTIEAVLPKRLHRFFFFDGERIEQLVKPSAYEEIETAIKGILGLEVVERAIAHTDEARKKLTRELRDIGTDKDRELADELEVVREERTRRFEQKDQLTKNLAALEGERNLLNEQLAQLAEAAELQLEREELERDLRESEEAIRSCNVALAGNVARRGWLAFVDGLADATMAIFDERRERGEIPGDIKRQFVEDLLARGVCICGCELKAHDEAHEHVVAWRERALDGDVGEAWVRLPAVAKGVVESRSEFFEQVDKLLVDRTRHRDARDRMKDKLGEISDALRHGENSTIKELEGARESAGEKITDEQRRRARVELDIEDFAKRERDLENELKTARAENERAELARRRVRVAQNCADIFREILALRTSDVREQLDLRLKQLYSKISFKAYVPVLDEGFRLDLRSTDGDHSLSVAKSTGENQILSLSFVGALAEHARNRHDDSRRSQGDGVLSFQGGIYPIVMDSPFGSLDVNYRQRISEAIPGLAPQVLVFVSLGQGSGVVAEQLAPRVHREYVVECHTPKSGLEPEMIELGSGTYRYITPAADGYERAEIVAVTP
jgi:DNA sulfur modification protein DndD